MAKKKKKKWRKQNIYICIKKEEKKNNEKGITECGMFYWMLILQQMTNE